MDLRHLRYFVTVAETGNVSRAAGHVRISQPALSRQIRDLEGELGVALFERTGRRLKLTGAGEDLLAHARKVLNEAEALRERARVLSRGNAGVLRVGGTPQVLERLFPAVLERFRRIMPSVNVRLTEGHPTALREFLRNGELHLAFTTFQPELRASSRPAGTISILVVSRGPRGGRPETIEVRELEHVPLLLLQRGYGSRDLFEATCQLARIRPNISLESNAPATLLALARAGAGVAVLPATVAFRGTGLVIQKLVHDGQPVENQLAVHWDPLRFLPSYAARFAEELAAQARAEFASGAAAPRTVRPSRRRR